jgi:8-oxo-dGTP pyrophosphatase MutT (NUDIX family)
MTVTNGEIADTLDRYLAGHPEERDTLQPLLDALDSEAELASRATVPVHVTCGAAVIDDIRRVLMIHHKTLDKWLLPGGHLEESDSALLLAALRELEEETGIPWQVAVSPPAMDIVPADIDIHLIPANPAKGEPEHWHADFRYALWVKNPDVQLQLDEVTDYAWRSPAELQTARLITKISQFAA